MPFLEETTCFERMVAGIPLLLDILMLCEIVHKLRCNKNDDGNEDSKYKLNISTEILLYIFYVSIILWHIFYVLTFTIIPLSNAMGISFEPTSLCNVTYTVFLMFSMIYQCALINILTNRVDTAFVGTEFELSKITNIAIRSLSVLVCVTVITFIAIYVSPNLYNHTHGLDGFTYELSMTCDELDCGADVALSEQDAVFAVGAYMIALLMSTCTLWIMFMVKLSKFRNRLFDNGFDPSNDDFLLNVIKKQSFIMCWVSMTTVTFTIIHFSMGPVMGQYVGRLPVIFDFEANAIGIFLSFSINQDWYSRFRCNLCADCAARCLFGDSNDTRKMVQLHVNHIQDQFQFEQHGTYDMDPNHQIQNPPLNNVICGHSSSPVTDTMSTGSRSDDCGGIHPTTNSNSNNNGNGNDGIGDLKGMEIQMEVMVKVKTDSSETELNPQLSIGQTPSNNNIVFHTHPLQYSMSNANAKSPSEQSPSHLHCRSPYSSRLSPGLSMMKHNRTLSLSTRFNSATTLTVSNRKSPTKLMNNVQASKAIVSEQLECKEMSESPRCQSSKTRKRSIGSVPMATPQSDLKLEYGVLKKRGVSPKPVALIHDVFDDDNNPDQYGKLDSVLNVQNVHTQKADSGQNASTSMHINTESGLQIVQETLETVSSNFDPEIE